MVLPYAPACAVLRLLHTKHNPLCKTANAAWSKPGPSSSPELCRLQRLQKTKPYQLRAASLTSVGMRPTNAEAKLSKKRKPAVHLIQMSQCDLTHESASCFMRIRILPSWSCLYIGIHGAVPTSMRSSKAPACALSGARPINRSSLLLGVASRATRACSHCKVRSMLAPHMHDYVQQVPSKKSTSRFSRPLASEGPLPVLQSRKFHIGSENPTG